MLNRLSEFHDWIGYLAGSLATLAFVPQVLKTLKKPQLEGVSLGMYALFCSGIGLWLLYGILISSWPIIVANFITLILSGTILYLKIKELTLRRNVSRQG